jgi:hypothetical protein
MVAPLLGLLLLASGIHAAPQAPTISAPRAIAELDLARMRGEPVRLAWSPDEKQLYLQTVEYDRSGNPTRRHWIIALDGDGGAAPPASADAEPAWAGPYWVWKSAPESPASTAWRIGIDSRRDTVRAASTPRGADIAGMGGDSSARVGGDEGSGTTVADALAAANARAGIGINTFKLSGQAIGEWRNTPVVPGQTFGWAPKQVGEWIAFAWSGHRGGRVTLLHREGARAEIEPSRNASLPAWSPSGDRLAWLQPAGRRKLAVVVADVNMRP